MKEEEAAKEFEEAKRKKEEKEAKKREKEARKKEKENRKKEEEARKKRESKEREYKKNPIQTEDQIKYYNCTKLLEKKGINKQLITYNLSME